VHGKILSKLSEPMAAESIVVETQKAS